MRATVHFYYSIPTEVLESVESVRKFYCTGFGRWYYEIVCEGVPKEYHADSVKEIILD